jgi:UDP-N-acetylglucosamine--N-acetylmuramyl-(pentapeptide) pyrophosphoryl-undecaprenol N-acetylglucosamine transferase
MQKIWSCDIMFIGTCYGIENRILPELPYRFKKIWMRGLLRKLSLANILFPVRLTVSLIQCLWYFLMFRPMLVIGTGGYVSGPALLAGLILRLPTVIQEQNSYPGLVNRWLGKHVDQVHITYEDSRKYFRQQANVFASGNPVRMQKSGIENKDALAAFNLQPGCVTMLVFGGSQGAGAINNNLLAIYRKLMTIADLQVIWITGERDKDLVEQKTEPYRQRTSVHAFVSEMMLAYRAADIALCRSGATTLSELAITGVPALLVPFPYSTEGHQEANAHSVARQNAAVVLPEKEITSDKLYMTIHKLVSDKEKLLAMRAAMLRLARPDAAGRILHNVEPLLNIA